MIEKNTVIQAIDALADSLQSRVSLTGNIIRLTLAESKLAFESLVLAVILGILALMLVVCMWLVLQMLIFAILQDYFALGSVWSLVVILTLHLVLIGTIGLLIQRLCRNLTFRHLREAMAPVTLQSNANHDDAVTGSSINNAEIENRASQDKGE
ncbi:MAG: hypothetical protein AB8B63_00520 [Granulosicoccus sp.]